MIAGNIWYLTSFWYWMWSPLLLWMPTKVVWDFLCLSFFPIFFSFFFLILFSFSAKNAFALLKTSCAMRRYSGLKANDLKRTTLLGHRSSTQISPDIWLKKKVCKDAWAWSRQGRARRPNWALNPLQTHRLSWIKWITLIIWTTWAMPLSLPLTIMSQKR